ncbi:N-acetylmuramoyl-L-alanine amidase [Candidatus Poriferisocius sp.]|uniref:N-acetylmuramoyl-L-alanine amidase n=1 Tax=Candidatus Poriferisocius sp. TaxID=3101276 RepID=UPI003B01F56E
MPNSARSYRSGIHQGVDFGCPERGRDAVAALDGRVVVAVGDYKTPTVVDFNEVLSIAHEVQGTPPYTLVMLYGNYVVMDHGAIDGVGHVISIYAHLEAIDPAIQIGGWVAAGQPVGYIGNSGTDDAAAGFADRAVHLHWEIHVDGRYLGEGLSAGDTREVYTALFAGPSAEPPDGSAGVPEAVFTRSGVPVVVLEQTSGGLLVRTPCGNTAEVSGGIPVEGVRVVLDPGHGGTWDSGAVGPNGLAERDLNLALSDAVLAELADRGIAAVSTRTGDYGVRLSVRAELADVLGVEALVSIHHNAPTMRTGDTPGTEVYIQSESAQQARADSARLGGLLYEEITTALGSFEGVAWSRQSDAGVLRVFYPEGGDAYGMIHGPSVPAVLVEYGYLSNPSEAALFATNEYTRTAASATADAIEAYLLTGRPGTGFVQQPRVFDPVSPPGRCDEIALD